MKLKIAVLPLLLVVITAPGFAQSSGSDAGTLNAILAELKAIHEDLKVSGQVQVLLAELQAQQSAVNQARARADQTRSSLTQVQADEKSLAIELKDAEDKLDHSSDPTEQKQLSEAVERLKNASAGMKIQEQNRMDAFDQAQQELRNSQDALDSTEEQLNALTKKLDPKRN